MLGVGMIMGDGVLTPSVSVLSSMEGLAVADPSNPRLQKGERAPHAKPFKVFQSLLVLQV